MLMLCQWRISIGANAPVNEKFAFTVEKFANFFNLWS